MKRGIDFGQSVNNGGNVEDLMFLLVIKQEADYWSCGSHGSEGKEPAACRERAGFYAGAGFVIVEGSADGGGPPQAQSSNST